MPGTGVTCAPSLIGCRASPLPITSAPGPLTHPAFPSADTQFPLWAEAAHSRRPARAGGSVIVGSLGTGLASYVAVTCWLGLNTL